jgi:hypothetical protein
MHVIRSLSGIAFVLVIMLVIGWIVSPCEKKRIFFKHWLCTSFMFPAAATGIWLGFQARLCWLYGFDPVWTQKIYIASYKHIRLSNGESFGADPLWFLSGAVGFVTLGWIALRLFFWCIRRFAPNFFRDAFPEVIGRPKEQSTRINEAA